MRKRWLIVNGGGMTQTQKQGAGDKGMRQTIQAGKHTATPWELCTPSYEVGNDMQTELDQKRIEAAVRIKIAMDRGNEYQKHRELFLDWQRLLESMTDEEFARYSERIR